jgi:hypothetical protein
VTLAGASGRLTADELEEQPAIASASATPKATLRIVFNLHKKACIEIARGFFCEITVDPSGDAFKRPREIREPKTL